MSYQDIITIEPDKRGGKPCIRRMRITVYDVLGWLSHVQLHDLAEKTDTEIWEFAKINDFCIVTQDVDFAERSRLYGSLPKVIWLRCGNAPTQAVESLLRSGVEVIQKLLDSPNLDCLELY
jgi:predicted nuclease of predicted toxin-antitoxin system